MNLIELIIKKMPKNLTDLEKARYIYIELGRLVSFDTSTLYNTNYNLFNEKLNKPIDISNVDSNLVNCYNWAQIYSKLLNMVNIKNTIKANQHAWVIMEIDNECIFADATNDIETDLSKIKAHKETDNFYLLSNELEILEPIDIDNWLKKLDKIDTKLGYTKERKDEIARLDILKRRVESIPNYLDKVDYVLSNIDLNNMNYFDGKDYIKSVLYYTIKDLTKIDAATLSKTQLNGDVISIKCITIKDNGTIAYYIYNGANKIFKINREDFEKIANMGYEVEGYKKIPYIQCIKNFTRYNFSKQGTLKLKREALYTKMYKDDPLELDNKKLKY